TIRRHSRSALSTSTGAPSARSSMTFRVRIDPVAQRHIDEFAAYLRDYSEEFAIEQIDRLEQVISLHIAGSPLTWAYRIYWRALPRLPFPRRPPHAILDCLHRRRDQPNDRHSSFLERRPRSGHTRFVAVPCRQDHAGNSPWPAVPLLTLFPRRRCARARQEGG